jgi:hypothetical protein
VSTLEIPEMISDVPPVSLRYASWMSGEELQRILAAFEAEGLEYVMIGAAAMGFHGLVRATEDLDLLVRADGRNLERLRRALRRAYPNDASIEEITDGDLLGEYPVVRYVPPQGTLYLDILTRLGEAVTYETVESQILRWESIAVRVATPAALYRLKRDTVRPLDRQDAAALRERFDLKEE